VLILGYLAKADYRDPDWLHLCFTAAT
jgi:hypothetical protein